MPARIRALAALLSVALTATLLAACASPERSSDVDPDQERMLAGVRQNPAVAATLPSEVRGRGELVIGANPGRGTPPMQFTDDAGRIAGVEADIRAAVGRVLGVRMRVEQASFEAILPALSSGKFDIGQSNFGVTEARKKTLDFVTYYQDGFGFVVSAADRRPPIRSITDLCGLRIATGMGTSFERKLATEAGKCAAQGKPPYQVSAYADSMTGLLAATQHKEDLFMLTAMGLQYAARQQPQRFRYVNKIYAENIGFVLAKGSPLAEPLRRAVQQLMDDGTVQRILDRWGVPGSALPRSEINPPGLD